MITSKIWRGLFTTVCFGLLGLLVFVGCDQGNTDNDTDDLGSQFVSDGGAGATLTIEITDDSLSVTETTPFTVTARDPRGAPLAFLRIFCESERGIAIVEPSSNGVAFEHTGSGGVMSGVLGALLPGSYLLECRAPIGVGLIARRSIVITGDVPTGFTGFPGAAGGNLGGGVIVDTSDVDTDNAVAVSGVSFSDSGGSGASLDITTDRTEDCDPSVTGTQQEPFGNGTVTLNITNNTTQAIVIDSVEITVDDGTTAPSAAANLATTIDASSSAGLSGIVLLRASVSPTTGTVAYSASGDTPVAGTHDVEISVTGHSESGDSFTIDATSTITLTNEDNCGSSSDTATTTTTTTTS